MKRSKTNGMENGGDLELRKNAKKKQRKSLGKGEEKSKEAATARVARLSKKGAKWEKEASGTCTRGWCLLIYTI